MKRVSVMLHYIRIPGLRQFTAIICWLVLLCGLIAGSVYGQEEQENVNRLTANSESELFLQLLIDKNIISKIEADAFRNLLEEYNVSGTKSTNAALVELLRLKGVITDLEAKAYLQRLHGSEDKNTQLNRTVEPRDRSAEEIEKKIKETEDSLLTRDRILERRLEDLENRVSEDLAAKLYKSKWAQGIKISGDLRLRYQSNMYDENNATQIDIWDDWSEAINTSEDESLYRYRARLGLKAKLLDPRQINVGKAEVGLRLATGNTNNPVSTNETMGDYFNKDAIVLDRAYLKWKYSPIEEIWGKKPQISLTGGRIANPFFCTDLVWDGDLNFEGAALTLTSDTLESNSWSAFLTAGAFPLQAESVWQNKDKWLFGYQMGIQHRPFSGLNYKLAVSYYTFSNVQGSTTDIISYDTDKVDDWDYTTPLYAQLGNSVFVLNSYDDQDDWVAALASEYEEINVTARIDIDRFYPVHVILWADYVKNLGYDKDKVLELQRTIFSDLEDIEEQTDGYQAGLTVGYPLVRNAGEWNCSFFYKYLEADAVLDAFTDSDFHGGGTNAEGWNLMLQFGLFKNIWLQAKYMSSDEVYQDPDDSSNTQYAVDTFQFDINAAF